MKNHPPFDLKATTLAVVDKLESYLTDSYAGNGKVLIQQPARALAELLQLERWIEQGGLSAPSAAGFLEDYLANTQHLHHPHYLGHQVASAHPAAGISDFINSIINCPASIYEMGPAAVTIERVMINWLLQKVGWFSGERLSDFEQSNGGGGVFTHGGSLANLTALSAARAAIAPEAWDSGTPRDLVLLCPEVSHYSVARSASILGLGADAIVPIAVDGQEVVKPEALLDAYQIALDEGKRVLAVVANACATTTGLYDPLEEIGAFCEEHGLWYHVDGAHGACALVSEKERGWMRGVEKADSLIWDMHKMMQTSILCAAVLFKEHHRLGTTFQQKGSYMFHEKEQPGFDTLPFTLECTKSGLGTKLFWVLAAEGEAGMARFVEQTYANTRRFYQLFQKHPDFACPYPPQSNILCVHYQKFGDKNAFQLAIRNEMVKRGQFYLTSAEIQGRRYLRLVVMNTRTNDEHILAFIKEVESVAAELNAE